MRAILTYHSVDESGSPISIDPATFRRHVDWLAAGRVRVVPLEAIASAGVSEAAAVAITFDDAFGNFATEAAPRLLERGLPVTLFVVTDHVGGTNAWAGKIDPRVPHLPLLRWDDIGGLVERGVTIGSHTRTHPRLPPLAAGHLRDELTGSADCIERELGTRPAWLAYPYGDQSAAVRAAAAECYAGAVTTEYRPVARHDDVRRLPRLDAWYFRSAGALERWHDPGFRRRLWIRRQARSARALIRRATEGM